VECKSEVENLVINDLSSAIIFYKAPYFPNFLKAIIEKNTVLISLKLSIIKKILGK